MSSVSTTIWPDADTVPTGEVMTYDERSPFALVRFLGDRSTTALQFRSGIASADQARYLRDLAELVTRLADELDPQNGAKP
jgi:hypothetical protein